MQLVDINRGPLDRACGLSELKFVTAAAATGVTIPGLPEAEAEELRDSLVALAEEAGLDSEEARKVLTEETYTQQIKDDVRQAREYGATGVPFFVIDERYGISGAQPREAFAGALSRAWADHSAAGSDTR
jgi:protein-disulfide isomerase